MILTKLYFNMQNYLCFIQPELSLQFFEDLWDGSLTPVYLAKHRNRDCGHTDFFAIFFENFDHNMLRSWIELLPFANSKQ